MAATTSAAKPMFLLTLVDNPNDADRCSFPRATKPFDPGCRTDMTLPR